MILRKLVFLFVLFALTFSLSARADLLHQWKFNGHPTDSVGSAHGILAGNASVTGGRLALDGASEMITSALDGNLTEKTLISWVSLNDLSQPGGGSALTVQAAGGGVFDGIVYGERATGQWMNGSNGFVRSVPDNGGAPETLTEPNEVMMAITYAANNDITIYRNGSPYSTNATQGTIQTYTAGNSNAIFGRRHTGGGNNQLLNGFIPSR